MRGDFIDNTTVANLVFNEWWTNDAAKPSEDSTTEKSPQPAPSEDNKPSEPSKEPKPGKDAGSSKNFGAGVATGMGILAAVVAALAAFAQQAGLVNVNVKALIELAQRVGLR